MTFRQWLLGALAAFCDGFVDGLPVGGPVGAGTAFADGHLHADLKPHHLLIEAAHVLAVPLMSGLADLRAYQKNNPLTKLVKSPTT
ncbi:MAG: hypothetical protein KGL39_45590 [Patescibacteria group bacterium]|nr:hypothetical protein [Patescibacteria group bacterium]